MAASAPDVEEHQLAAQQEWFGRFGGRFVPEALMAVLEEVAAAYETARVKRCCGTMRAAPHC